jgi:hypothetical protein
MKVGMIATIAALAAAMTLGANVSPADAGDKGKNHAHQQGSGKVHFRLNKDPHKARVTTKNLELLEKQFRGNKLTKRQHDLKHALSGEIGRRRGSEIVGDVLGDKRGADAILGILGAAESSWSGH